jgi:hypothetical protein
MDREQEEIVGLKVPGDAVACRTAAPGGLDVEPDDEVPLKIEVFDLELF